MAQPRTTPVCLWNGAPAPDDRLPIGGGDPAVLRGLTAFETVRTYNGRVFRLEQHLARLAHSARCLNLDWAGASVVADEVRDAAWARAGESMVRITLFGQGRRLVRASDLPQRNSTWRCVRLPWSPPSWLPGSVKHGSRAFGIAAAQVHDVHEVVWVGADGCLLEANRSNVFVVQDGALRTPATDGRILEGVTRQAVLDACAHEGVPVQVGPVDARGPFDEVYLSSTLKELQPVVLLDGGALPASGPVGAQAQSALRSLIERETSG